MGEKTLLPLKNYKNYLKQLQSCPSSLLDFYHLHPLSSSALRSSFLLNRCALSFRRSCLCLLLGACFSWCCCPRLAIWTSLCSGILQLLELDPIPWVFDVVARICHKSGLLGFESVVFGFKLLQMAENRRAEAKICKLPSSSSMANELQRR